MEIIGIATAVQTMQSSPIPGKIGMITPINKNRKLIEYYNTRLPNSVIKRLKLCYIHNDMEINHDENIEIWKMKRDDQKFS